MIDGKEVYVGAEGFVGQTGQLTFYSELNRKLTE